MKVEWIIFGLLVAAAGVWLLVTMPDVVGRFVGGILIVLIGLGIIIMGVRGEDQLETS